MSIINTKNVEVFIQVGAQAGITSAPISISKASPAVVTLASAANLAKGDVVTFSNTTFSELDGKTFAIGEVTLATNSFTVLGSDTTNSTGVIPSVGALVTAIPANAMVKLCLSSMEIGADTVNTIDVSTYCDTSAQIPGKSTPGTITLSGYADKDDTGLAEIIKAADDQQVRAFEIVLPNDNGYIVGQVSLSGLSYGVPIEGAVTFSVTGTQASKIRWVSGPSTAAAIAAGPAPMPTAPVDAVPTEPVPVEPVPVEPAPTEPAVDPVVDPVVDPAAQVEII